MNKQNETDRATDFMKLMTEGQMFESSELKLSQRKQEEDSYSRFKKRNNMMNFLMKIKEQTMDMMEKYLSENKNEPHPIRNKITLYEDIAIIYEFKKNLVELQYDSSRMTDVLCSQLQMKFGRSKITIKERIKKKLCHFNDQDIINAIRFKREFVFDKSKRPVSSDEPPQRLEQASQYQNQHQSPLRISNMRQRQSQVKIQQAPQKHSHCKSPLRRVNSIYQYGSKNIQQPIFVHVKMSQKIIRVLQYSTVQQIRKKQQNVYQENVSNEKEKEKENKEDNDEGTNTPKKQIDSVYKIVCTFSQQFEKFVQSQNNGRLDKEKLQKFVSTAKGQVNQILSATKRLKDIHRNESVLQIQQIFTNTMNQLQQLQRQTKKAVVKGEETSHQEQKSALEDSQRKQRKLLYSVSNSLHAFQLIAKKQHLTSCFNWSQDQDALLYRYSFDNQAYEKEIKFLLMCKSEAAVVERIKFLCAPENQQMFAHLHSIMMKINQ